MDNRRFGVIHVSPQNQRKVIKLTISLLLAGARFRHVNTKRGNCFMKVHRENKQEAKENIKFVKRPRFRIGSTTWELRAMMSIWRYVQLFLVFAGTTTKK
uniref:Uncharacterized protein n=1 Tax=Arundo donax TaxID=35708 RepID=A0A0A9AJP4_ARUDO